MSQQLISRSPDLTKLRNEGYDIEVRAGHLLVKHVPYVDADRQVHQDGILASTLESDGTVATQPTDHTVRFAGAFPCKADGSRLDAIHAGSGDVKIDDSLTVHHHFSTKPPVTGRYADYYEKMATYANQISSHAEAIDPSLTPRPFLPVEAGAEDSVFHYIDTASARAGISAINQKLALARVAIVGLGGTGSYVLDQVAKTPVGEIHLFDGDVFSSHNAFRAPGAASIEELRDRSSKVDYLIRKYEMFRRGLVPHGYVDETNVGELAGMDFVFLCMDGNAAKRMIVESLEQAAVRLVDVGMGLHQTDDAIHGQLRVTTSTPDAPALSRIPFSVGDHDEYATNIQVADLNALNAALAVIRWKKLFGFYVDLEGEMSSVYAIDGNQLVND